MTVREVYSILQQIKFIDGSDYEWVNIARDAKENFIIYAAAHVSTHVVSSLDTFTHI